MPSVLSVYCKDGGQFHVSDDIIKACGVFRNFHAHHSIYVDIDERLFRWVLASRGKDLRTLEKELIDMDDQMLLGIVYATTNLQHQQLGKLAINAVNARMMSYVYYTTLSYSILINS
ncbi:hypothetical protein ABKN59_003264 [Abortiporus biennis]